MRVSDRMAAILAPHLGAQSAVVVSRHLCAKYGVEDTVSAEQLSNLVEFLRRGLVAYVGTDKARELAEACEVSIAGA